MSACKLKVRCRCGGEFRIFLEGRALVLICRWCGHRRPALDAPAPTPGPRAGRPHGHP